jgi:TusA-related sulfurtransferase
MRALYLDESVCEQQDCHWPNCRGFLVVGGYLFNLTDSALIEEKWLGVRATLGLGREYPLKWAPDSRDHETIKQMNLTMSTLRKACVQSISTMPVTAYVCTMLDVRKQVITTPRDSRILYPEAMKYVLQRAVPSVPRGDQLLVVIDRPAGQETLKRQPREKDHVILRYADAGPDNSFSAFQDYRFNGNSNVQYSRFAFAPLRETTCPLSLLMGVTRFDSFLQIADIITSAFRNWITLELTLEAQGSTPGKQLAFARQCVSSMWPLLDRAGGTSDISACSQGLVVFGDPQHKTLAEILCTRRGSGPVTWGNEVLNDSPFL